MIKIFYFCAQLGDWRNVLARHVHLIEASGLAEASGDLQLCLAGDPLITPRLPSKWRLTYRSRLDQFEFPALDMLYNNTLVKDRVLYLHAKGVSRSGEHREPGRAWCDFMSWGCVEHWREMLAALEEGHDVAGVQWTRLNLRYKRLCGASQVFAGNFWWARGDWILSLPPPQIEKRRFRAEGWVVSRGAPKVFDFHNLTAGQLVTVNNAFYEPGFCRARYTAEPDPYPASAPVPFRQVPKRCRREETRASGPRSRAEIINALCRRFGHRSYLEIGVFQFHCFRAVNAEVKACVDPAVAGATFRMTSDAFFQANSRTWDLIFVDGLHLAQQVLRDVENALACLSPGGTVVCHDCNPETVFEQRYIPEYDGQGIWTGTVWQAWALLRMTRPDLTMAVIDTDFGVGVIRKGRQEVYRPPADLAGLAELREGFPRDYRLLVRDRKRLLPLLPAEEFGAWLSDLA